MANMTLAIPDDVHKQMKQFPDISWSAVARRAIIQKMELLDQIEKILEKSKLTEKDVEEFSKLIKRKATERFLDENRDRLKRSV